MKIKITENQYSKIRLILEQEEYLTQFKNFCNQKVQEVNQIYSKIINTSVSEVISGQVNIEETQKLLYKIEDDVDKARRNIENLWNQNLIGGDDDNFDLIIWDIADTVTSKINPLSLVLYGLAEVQEKSESILTQFKDVKPIEIQSY